MKMKGIIKLLLLLILSLFVISACSDDSGSGSNGGNGGEEPGDTGENENPTEPTISVTGVTLTISSSNGDNAIISADSKSATIEAGDEVVLVATIFPEDATDTNIGWSTSDRSVATITDNGDGTAIVKGEDVGNVTITVKTRDGGFSDEVSITVFVAVESIAFNYTGGGYAFLKNDMDNAVVTAYVTPSNATNQDIKYYICSNNSCGNYSESNDYVSINSDTGAISINEGINITSSYTFTVIAVVDDTSGTYTDTASVTIYASADDLVKAKVEIGNITLGSDGNGDKVSATGGKYRIDESVESFSIAYTISGDGGEPTSENVYVSSSNENIVSCIVSYDNSLINCSIINVGETTITITPYIGDDSAEVTVRIHYGLSEAIKNNFSEAFLKHWGSNTLEDYQEAWVPYILQVMAYHGIGNITNENLATTYGAILGDVMKDSSGDYSNFVNKITSELNNSYGYDFLANFDSYMDDSDDADQLITQLKNINDNADNIDKLVETVKNEVYAIDKDLMEYNFTLAYAKAASYLALVGLDYCANNGSYYYTASECESTLEQLKENYLGLIESESYYEEIINTSNGNKSDNFYLGHFKNALELYLEAAYLLRDYAEIWYPTVLDDIKYYISTAESYMNTVNGYGNVSSLVSSEAFAQLIKDTSENVPNTLGWTDISQGAYYVGADVCYIFGTNLGLFDLDYLINDDMPTTINAVNNLEVEIKEDNIEPNLYYFVASFIGKLDSGYINNLKDDYEYVLPSDTSIGEEGEETYFYEDLAYAFITGASSNTYNLSIAKLNYETTTFSASVGDMWTALQSAISEVFGEYEFVD